jgi:DNA-binding beta-propeller fold protein YncE
VEDLSQVQNPSEYSIALVGTELYCIIENEWRKVIEITSPSEAKFVICDYECLFVHFGDIRLKYPIDTENIATGMIAITESAGYIYIDNSWKRMAKFDIVGSDNLEIPEEPIQPEPPDESIITITEIPPTNEVIFDGSVMNLLVIDPKDQIAVRPDLKFNISLKNLQNFKHVYIRVNCPDTMYSIDGTEADNFSLNAGGIDFTNALYRITKIAETNYIELLEFTSLM